MANVARPATSFERTLRTALGFLANPCNVWNSERLEDRPTVLKLVFTERLCYARKDGFRAVDLSLPFKALGALVGGESRMARAIKSATLRYRKPSMSPKKNASTVAAKTETSTIDAEAYYSVTRGTIRYHPLMMRAPSGDPGRLPLTRKVDGSKSATSKEPATSASGPISCSAWSAINSRTRTMTTRKTPTRPSVF